MEIMTRALLNAAAAILLAVGLPSWADAPAPPGIKPAPASGTDPFVKKNAPDPVDPSKPQSTLALTYEFYRLGQADGAKLLQGDATDEELYAGLRDLVKQDKAQLSLLQAGEVANGEQLVLEQVDSMPYPIAYEKPGDKLVIPSDFKRRNVGDRLVLKPQTVQGGQACDLSMFPEQTRLRGFDNQNLYLVAAPYIACMPVFETSRFNVKPPLIPFDKIRFLGTCNPALADALPANVALAPAVAIAAAAKEPEMGLFFTRASRLDYQPADKPKANPSGINLELSAYSTTRDQAWQILTQPTKPGSVYDAVQALAQVGQAKLEHLAVLRTQDGVKSNGDEVTEYAYPTSFNSDQTVAQDVGFSGEVRAEVLGNGAIVNLDVTKFQIIRNIGPLQSPGPVAEQVSILPVFQLQSVVTNLNAGVGEHAFLGTLSPPGDTGVNASKDDGRVWFAFIQARPVYP